MTQRYAELIEEWRVAAAIERLRRLRDIEHTKLDAVMAYARKTASGPPTGVGSL